MSNADDNRTTELREKLTERGIEYATNDHMGVCETSWNGFTAMQLTPSAKLIMAVTPEQAIAATLGSDTCVIESTRYIESDIPDSWYEFDLSCGYTVKSAQVPPNYCEECGKKIDLQGVSYV